MNWGSIALCCWPGLPGLWYRGRWSSLMVAIGFSLLLNLAIISSFIWTEVFFDEGFPAVAWPVLLMFWTVTAWLAFQNLPDVMSVKTRTQQTVFEHPDTLFIDARSEYLKGQWQQAEGLLLRSLIQTPRDIEARLMLATLYRHTRQFDNATVQLDKIDDFDESATWRSELLRERKLLELVMEHERSSVDPDALKRPTNNDGIVRVVKKDNQQNLFRAVDLTAPLIDRVY